MEAEAPPASPDAPQGGQLAEPGADRPAERPWRTEGLPKGQPPDPRRRWVNGAIWDRWISAALRRVHYSGSAVWARAGSDTEFKTQVSTKNVAELFAQGDSIEGQLKKAEPRHNILLADDTAVRAAVLTRAHPAAIPGPRLKIQKHDPTYCGGGEHDSGDGHELHLLLPPVGAGDTRLVRY